MIQAPALSSPEAIALASSASRPAVLSRGIRYTSSIPRFALARLLGKRYPVQALPLQLVNLPPVASPAGWEVLRVRLAGICGSDLSLLYGKNSPALSPFFSFPAILGHEVLAETGGVRVAVNPLLTVAESHPDQLSREILPGHSSEMLGFSADCPGGWADLMVAPVHRLHPVPDSVSDACAVLAEPLAVVVRAAQQLQSHWPGEILVIGAGTIGLLLVKTLRLLGYGGPLHVVARRPRQAELAQLFGANAVHASTVAAQEALGARPYRGLLGSVAWRGGFSAVVEASGSPAGLQEASWAVREGGKVVLVGAPGLALHDLAPYWYREIQLVGTYVYSPAQFGLALELLTQAPDLEQLIGPRFPLEAWPQAIRAALKYKGSKVLFQPQPPVG